MFCKKGICLPVFLFFCLLFAQNTQAQDDDRSYRGPEHSDSDEREARGFGSRLWYGGGLSVGFSAFNNQSAFGIGVAPMVGYKFWGPLSAGPRVAVFFTSQKYPGAKAVGLFDLEAGAFLRCKVYKGFFLQGELSNSWEQEPYEQIGNRITKRTYQRFNQYLGAGYNFGNGAGGPGSEISIHYNFAVANDLNAYQQPLDYRFTLTYGF